MIAISGTLHRDRVRKAIELTLTQAQGKDLDDEALEALVENLHHVIFSDEIEDMLRGLTEDGK